MRLNKKFFAILIVAVLCAAAYFSWDYFASSGEKISYKEFWQSVERDEISSVKFEGEKIYFEKISKS